MVVMLHAQSKLQASSATMYKIVRLMYLLRFIIFSSVTLNNDACFTHVERKRM